MSLNLNATAKWDINNFFIRPKKIKDKRYVFIYGCCVQENLGESILAEDFEKMLDKDSGFEDFINSYFKYSCLNTKMMVACSLSPNEDKSEIKGFFGINNCLFIPCNLNCNFCRWQNEKPEFTKEDIEYYKKLYFKLLDKWADSDFEYLRLTEYGEPLLPIEDNIKFFEKIKKKKTIAITTNGVLLDKYLPIFEKFKDIIDFKIIVSLNAYNSEIYKYKMNSDKFEKVIENIYLARDFVHKITFFIDDREKNNTKHYYDFIKNVLHSFGKEIDWIFLYDLRNPKKPKFKKGELTSSQS